MYLPNHFAETDLAALHALMRAHPLATVVAQTAQGMDANHIPLHLCAGATGFGRLQGHLARANPLWRNLTPDTEVLVIFSGPEAYITPSWYPGKQETGKAVPTWNYAAVHAYGTARVIDDPAWLRQQVEQLTAEHEQALANPWQVSDAPADYIEKMLAAIVGVEIDIVRLIGKTKASQNQPANNREGVVQGLQAVGTSNAQAMAALVAAAKA